MNWKIELGQVTTGHGAALLGPTLLAVATGTMTWMQALPLLAGGVILVLWPENATLSDQVKTLVTDAMKIYGTVATPPAPPATPVTGAPTAGQPNAAP